jgi:hypothetical protein
LLCSYLWPLIHYHKFLAKCIKKLKRNGVDVKVSVSPVAVFLREEVCSVSDHLARVSHFGSDEWMSCLELFHGWVDGDDKTEERIRSLILGMKLRPLSEPGDVDSPLLRSQIDEQFLRSMVAVREQMTSNSSTGLTKPSTKIVAKKIDSQLSTTTVTSMSSRPGLPLHPKSRHLTAPPGFSSNPKYSRPPSAASRSRQAPSLAQTQASSGQIQNSHQEGAHSARQNKYGYYWPGWTPQYALCDDGTSVESALSGDSYMHQYPGHDYGMYLQQQGYYQYPSYSSHTPDPSMNHSETGSYPNVGSYDGSYYPMPGLYYSNPNMGNSCWYPPMGDPSMVFGPPPVEGSPLPSGPLGSPPSPQYPPSPMENGNDRSPHVPNSPFWGHLDYNTLAISGIMTPQGKMPPTPSHRLHHGEEETIEEEKKESPQIDATMASPHQFNGVQYYPPPIFGAAREGYAPPSPATQFMMSPQANSQAAAYYAYSYPTHYYMSPHRHGGRRTPPHKSSPAPSHNGNKEELLQKVEENGVELAPHAQICKPAESSGRSSPATVATMAESESVSGEEREPPSARV